MDIDIIKPYNTEDHHDFDIMTMMMQMEKPPQNSCTPQENLSIMQNIEFPGTTSLGIIPAGPAQFQNHNVALSPIMVSQQVKNTIVPFMAAQSVQEPMTPPQQPNIVTVGKFRSAGHNAFASQHEKQNSVAAMREMIFRMAVMQPIHIDPESIKPPKRRNVKISKDPQSVAARHRRERISERIGILQRLVPGGTKMDTASMLDEAIHYVKFLKKQVQTLEQAALSRPLGGVGFSATAMGKLH